MTNYHFVVVVNKNELKTLRNDIDDVSRETYAKPKYTSVVTPDETYVAITWLDIDMSGPAVEAFNRKIDDLLHARAVIDLDTCMPTIDRKSYADYGTDEEFDELLQLKTTLSLSRMRGKTVKVCDSSF